MLSNHVWGDNAKSSKVSKRHAFGAFVGAGFEQGAGVARTFTAAFEIGLLSSFEIETSELKVCIHIDSPH